MVYVYEGQIPFTFGSRFYCGSNNHLLFIIQIRKKCAVRPPITEHFVRPATFNSACALRFFLFDPMLM